MRTAPPKVGFERMMTTTTRTDDDDDDTTTSGGFARSLVRSVAHSSRLVARRVGTSADAKELRFRGPSVWIIISRPTRRRLPRFVRRSNRALREF